MEEIYEPNAEFDFDRVTLCPPTLVTGGNYFIKFKIADGPLYIQCPKSTTKQGIAKAGKKYFCDLLLSNENYEFIQWMENLETYSQDAIYKNREKWFEAGLEKHDIENSFLSSLKTYKSGKFYILRTNVPTRLGKNVLKIYDDSETLVESSEIKETSNVITILEIQGIKCSARSFQLEFEIKQMMLIKPSQLFERCIIKTKNASHDLVETRPILPKEEIRPPTDLGEIAIPIVESPITEEETPISLIEDKDIEINPIRQEPEFESDSEDEEVFQQVKKEPQFTPSSTPETTERLEEFELDLDEIPKTEIVQLKNRNDVYYKMYRDALRNAKIAKDLALSSYLEAKRIKNTYMLTDLDESDDSDFEDNLDKDVQ